MTEPGETDVGARAAPLRLNVVTIFPEFFAGPLALSIPSRARRRRCRVPRRRSARFHARPASHRRRLSVRRRRRDGHEARAVLRGGGVAASVGADRAHVGARPAILAGRRDSLCRGAELTLLCGHYKDVDQRVADFLATEELSLGDFVLSGGEPAALAVIDATVRLLPGAMSDLDSARSDSFFDRDLSAPSYTRPPDFRGHAVPEILLSGDHKKIEAWRRAEAERLSRVRRER